MSNLYFVATTARAFGRVVSGELSLGTPQVGPDVAYYGAVPADVISKLGEAADAFFDFPLT